MRKNKINTYGYNVLRHNKYHMPLFVVEIYSDMLSGIYFFNSNRDASTFIQKEKAELKNYGIELNYGSDFHFNVNCLASVQNSVCVFSKIQNRQIYCFS